MNINRSFRLPELEHFPEPQIKSGICIHHTVGGTAASTMDWWLRDGAQVGTAYIIERDGTIFEVFDPRAWAWQFGLKWSAAKKTAFEKRFIGIEIASEGGLTESGGNLYAFDRVTEKTRKPRDQAYDFGEIFRGYRFFDSYESAQMDSLIELVNHLLDEFQIPRRHPDKPLAYYGDWLEKFEGIIGHTMVRKDKSDPIPDINLWARLRESCGVRAVEIKSGRETPFDFKALNQSNLEFVTRLLPVPGSLIKGLVLALEQDAKPSYIRLLSVQNAGRGAAYEIIEGSKSSVKKIANALGLSVSDTLLSTPIA